VTTQLDGIERLGLASPTRNGTSMPVTEQQARRVGEWRNIWYRSYPTRRDYSFTYTFTDGGWRIYINNSPDYGSRPSDSTSSHRLDVEGRPFICWTEDITTLSDAQAVSALWADATEQYIVTGRFEPPRRRPMPVDKSVINGHAGLESTRQSAVSAPDSAINAPIEARSILAQPRRSLWSRLKDQPFTY